MEVAKLEDDSKIRFERLIQRKRPLLRNEEMRAEDLNQQCIERLKEAGVGRGNYIAVVGAGPSSLVFPSGSALVTQIAQACGLATDDPRPFWEFFEEAKKRDRDAYCRIINERFQDQPFLRFESYKQIVSVPFKSFITLNYDYGLPAAFADRLGDDWEKMFSVYPMRDGPNGETTGLASAVDLGHKRRLVAVHGYRDPRDLFWPATKIVLTASDYERHYRSSHTGAFLANWWKDVLALHDCLFIGTSLQEPGLRIVVDHLLKDGNPDFLCRRHLHLKDVSLCRTRRQGTNQIIDAYPAPEMVFGIIPQVQYDPQNNFSGLVEVLSPFSRITTRTIFEPGMPALGPIAPLNP